MEHFAVGESREAPVEEAGEDRGSPRFTLLIRAAKLVCAQGEFLCVIRDVSTTGISVRMFHPLPTGQQMALELQTGDSHEVERVWASGTEAGFRFMGDIDITRLIAEVGKYPKRKLRLRVQMPAIVLAQGRRAEALVHNISQQGAKIETCEIYARDQLVRIKPEGLPEIRAKVRWSREGCYGLVFEDTFSLRELARLAAALQCPALLEGIVP